MGVGPTAWPSTGVWEISHQAVLWWPFHAPPFTSYCSTYLTLLYVQHSTSYEYNAETQQGVDQALELLDGFLKKR